MSADGKRYLVRALCAIVTVGGLAACSVEVFGPSDEPAPPAPSSPDGETGSEAAAAAETPAPDVALVVGTAPQQRIGAVEPGRNAAAGLIGDTENVDYGGGALTADYGAPPPAPELAPEPMPEPAPEPAPETAVRAAPELVEVTTQALAPDAAGAASETRPASTAEPEIPDFVAAEGPEPPDSAAQRAAMPETPAAPSTQAAAPESGESGSPPPGGAPDASTDESPGEAAGETVAAASPAAAEDTATAGAQVQLAAFRSPADVEAAWASLRRDHPDLLADLTLSLSEIDLGDRGVFYRLLAGPLADAGAARRLCAALQARGQDCLVRAD